MEKTWKPQIAGILSIVGGVIGLFGSLGILIAILAVGITGNWAQDWGFGWLPFNVFSILWALAIPMFICGVAAIAGGIFALLRKAWGMALAGSIAAFFPAWILGLGSIILIATSRDEFGKQNKPMIVNQKTN
jgi:hypothetical protein